MHPSWFLILALSSITSASTSNSCIKWRSTINCDSHGERDSRNDLACDQIVPKKRAGYCECEGRRRVREVNCDHHPFTCEKACKEDHSAQLRYPEGFEHVTCGSILKLVHETSRFRLHSQELSYGTGSQQQLVSATVSQIDVNSDWVIKEGDGDRPCVTGDKIRCGSTMRLEHVNTRHNLHSHDFKAPLTNSHNEVSAFGDAGTGDTSDNWILECVEDQQCTAKDQCEDNEFWRRGQLVRLRHAKTGALLFTSHKNSFDNSNCPNCPIIGQQEVSASKKNDHDTLWFAGEGIYVAH